MAVTSLAHPDTYSSPFYNYAYDVMYVGDNSGDLEVSAGVFDEAAPASATAYNLGHTNDLASPIFDETSGCIFVGDTSGYLYSVNSGIPGTVCTSAGISANATSELLGAAASEGIFDAPLVDPTYENVYAFVAGAATSLSSACTTGNNCIAQFPTSFATGAGPSSTAHVGTGGVSYPLYAGDFDNVFYSSSSVAGDIWVMGNTGTFGGILYRIPITTGGALGTVATMVSPVTADTTGHFPWSSPITEFCSGTCTANGSVTTSGTDYIFFSVDRLNTTEGSCGSASGDGCILAYTITNPTSGLTLGGASGYLGVTTQGTPGCWSSGGLVIDNSDTTNGSNVYFIGLNGATPTGVATGTNYCSATDTATLYATQAAQSGL
jgi:hypothetical protein